MDGATERVGMQRMTGISERIRVVPPEACANFAAPVMVMTSPSPDHEHIDHIAEESRHGPFPVP